ncbi:hypothetical protein WJX72_006754 [[Myrmecia] bisecta]|uniref:Proteasome assembly chaperone 3 n=1 Tax=[Myrmecia] bisecta TaxID=41462 RepID=A0AAW1PX68_9CHLO
MSMTFPVQSLQFSSSVTGHRTCFLASAYSDSILLVATQLGTLGTVLQAKSEINMEGEADFSIVVLLGKRDEPLLTLCTRRLAEGVAAAAGNRRALVVGLALKEHSMEAVREVVQQFMAHPVW